MRQKLTVPRPLNAPHLARNLPAGAGFVIAAFISLAMFALILGIAAIA